MGTSAITYIMLELERITDYVVKEFDSSYAEVIGCLHMKAYELCAECMVKPSDGDDEVEPHGKCDNWEGE